MVWIPPRRAAPPAQASAPLQATAAAGLGRCPIAVSHLQSFRVSCARASYACPGPPPPLSLSRARLHAQPQSICTKLCCVLRGLSIRGGCLRLIEAGGADVVNVKSDILAFQSPFSSRHHRPPSPNPSSRHCSQATNRSYPFPQRSSAHLPGLPLPYVPCGRKGRLDSTGFRSSQGFKHLVSPGVAGGAE